jgi:F0F1-type ATP synthase membrane subunit a
MAFIVISVKLIKNVIKPVSLAIMIFANLVMGYIMIANVKFVTTYLWKADEADFFSTATFS